MLKAQADELILQNAGYRVVFEWIDNGILRSDHVPSSAQYEPPFQCEEQAWDYAQKLADALKGRACNFYVVHAKDFTPVQGYVSKKIVNR